MLASGLISHQAIREYMQSCGTAADYSNGVRKKGGKAEEEEEEELDEESKQGLARIKASDGEIYAGIDAIARTMDNITNMAAAMREETLNQNDKLEKMDQLMDTSVQKQMVSFLRL
jgi:predicted double-glycine peptidase